jgi:hypothetical protein
LEENKYQTRVLFNLYIYVNYTFTKLTFIITNTAWARARLCKLQKGCTRLATASHKVYQLLANGRWFSPGTPASSTKTGHHDIAEILLKVAIVPGYF